VAAAIVTGLTIATYTVIDGLGVRLSGSPIGYIGWLFLLETFSCFYIFYIKREVLKETSVKVYLTGLVGGIVSAVAYGLAIYAKSIASLGAVSAIRESSVIIAALIGVIWFRERPWKVRVLSACVVALGVIILSQSG
jgi:drug/metabolite transporter (DMT)-like permease